MKLTKILAYVILAPVVLFLLPVVLPLLVVFWAILEVSDLEVVENRDNEE